MGRGRKAIPVTKEALQGVVTTLESVQVFASRSALWAAVADTTYAKTIGLSAQVAMLKAKEFAIEIKTALGQRGRAKGSGPVPNAGKRKRKRRISLPVVEQLKQIYPPSLHKKVDRAAAGSLKAAVALKCVDCSGGSKKEVALCTIQQCPLWGFRPYGKAYLARIEAEAEEFAEQS